jgi:MoxR-like ATPase
MLEEGMYYTKDVSDIRTHPEVEITVRGGIDHPSGYLPDPGLVDAVNVALVLNKPLLLTGEPGTGKTKLAYSVAWQLASRKQLNVTTAYVEQFETKSTSLARDLYYTFDTLNRFHAAQSGGSPNNVDYISYNALGRALLNALPFDCVRQWLPSENDHAGPMRMVVLIDEIDKAPRDFPNDLLNEIEHMYFRIPELRNAQVGGPNFLDDDLRPIVFITSNSEKNLPDPFLRRCIYYNIPFPDQDRLHEILISRISQLGMVAGPLIEDAVHFFSLLREENIPKGRISPAELIQWLTFILMQGAKPEYRLRDAGKQARAGLGALIKNPTDQENVRNALETFLTHT